MVHEVCNDAVELESVVKALTGQLLKIGHGLRHFVGKELGFDGSLAGFNRPRFTCSLSFRALPIALRIPSASATLT